MESRYSSLYASAKPVMALLADSNDKRKDAAELTKLWGNEIDTRSAGEVIADLGQKGIDAIPIVVPSNHLFIGQPDGSITSALSIDGRS